MYTKPLTTLSLRVSLSEVSNAHGESSRAQRSQQMEGITKGH